MRSITVLLVFLGFSYVLSASVISPRKVKLNQAEELGGVAGINHNGSKQDGIAPIGNRPSICNNKEYFVYSKLSGTQHFSSYFFSLSLFISCKSVVLYHGKLTHTTDFKFYSYQ